MNMDVIAQTQDGGVSNLAVGTYTADGTAVDVNCGFKPRYVHLLNLTDRISDEKFFEMLDTQTLMTVAAGTRTLETGSRLVLRDGIEDDFRGFTAAAAASLNGKVYHFVAFG